MNIMETALRRGWRDDGVRPNGIDILTARSLVKKHGPYHDPVQTATIIWDIVSSAAGGDKKVYMSRKVGGYVPFESNMPWEWWLMYAWAFQHAEVRARVKQRLRRHLPGLEIRPRFEREDNFWNKQSAYTLSFMRSQHDVMLGQVREIEQKLAYLDRRRKVERKVSDTQWKSVWVYQDLLNLPKDHPVRTDPEVVKNSRRLDTYVRRKQWLHDIWRSNIKRRMVDDNWIAWHDYQPTKVEALCFQRAVVAAWERHFPGTA